MTIAANDSPDPGTAVKEAASIHEHPRRGLLGCSEAQTEKDRSLNEVVVPNL